MSANTAGQPPPTGTLNTVLPPDSSMNRKALRKARKSAAKTAGDIVVSVANDQEARAEESSIKLRPDEDTIEYECCICGDDFSFSNGVAHCAAHFMCNECVVDAYKAAIADMEAFPAQCCTPLPRRFVEHLLSPEPWNHEEGFHQDDGCPSYGDPVEGYDAEGYELGDQGLHRDTGYNRAGFDRFGQQQLSHAAVEGTSADEYDTHSDDEGPGWDEEVEIDFEDDENPDFNDHGYDGELDLDVDFNDDEQYPDNEQADGWASEDEIDLDPADPAQNPDHSNGEVEAWPDDQANNLEEGGMGMISVPMVQDFATTDSEVDAAQNEAASAASTDEADQIEAAIIPSSNPAPTTQQRPRPSPPSDQVRQRIRLARRVPILSPNPYPEDRIFSGGTPSFQQLECSHSWHRQVLCRTGYEYAHCRGCRYTANSWTNFCSTCGVVACDWCTYSFRARFAAKWKSATNLLDVLIWAEEGVVPFKGERRNASEQREWELWVDCDGDGLGLAAMMEVHEAQLFELQPYMYWDFGIQLMFEELELEMQKECWAVTEEDVGIPGLTLTFDLATNPFAPLHWDK
ncbi:hypothetical protein G6011_00795 [Alternaria panax]|uniref:Uncharacterized protein n=1 Tax=Alternaria panax TaxID=48097 RepID=A0AAD4IJJ5_9PLEO|nr:hypothetical protein G6011_00795 [Alternaria panax]